MSSREGANHFRLAPAWLIAIAIACATGTAARAEESSLADFDQLEREFQKASESKDYAKALETAEKMHEIIAPKHINTLYNIAGMHCLLGHQDQAYAWLEKAIDAGYHDARRLRRDDDFASLRSEERFEALATRAWIGGYIANLERAERAEYQKPDEVVAALALKPGERVADIGAGSGYFTIRVARAVGPTGVVWAIDIHQEMLDYIDRRLKLEKRQNVRLKLVPEDDPQLPPAGVDTVLIVDTWHHIQDRPEYARKLRAALAPGGRVVIIDYIPKSREERPWGPRPEYLLSREAVDAEMAAAGLVPIKVHDFLPEQHFVEYGVK